MKSYLQTVLLIGIVLPAFFTCSKQEKSVSIIGTWGGTELANFTAVCAEAGIPIQFETTRDLNALLTTRIETGNQPDCAILPNPAKMKELILQGKLKALDFLDKEKLSEAYAKAWLDLGSYGGKLYGIFYKIGNKSVIWYNPQEFDKQGWKVPGTWEELIQLNTRIRARGKTPWSIGADVGWPLSDWIENIYIRTAGPEMYQKWIDHAIPWTHPSVKKAFETWGELLAGGKNLAGGVEGTLSATFQNAAFSVFRKNPKAYLYFEGSFMGDIVPAELDHVAIGTNMAFFPFPAIDRQYKNCIVGGADVIVVFRDTPLVKKLITFLTAKEAHEIWVKKGGFVSHNRNVPPESYPDPVNRQSAEMVTKADIFVFDASDLMPSAVGNQGGFWDACKRYLQNPGDLDAILADMEKLAQAHY